MRTLGAGGEDLSRILETNPPSGLREPTTESDRRRVCGLIVAFHQSRVSFPSVLSEASKEVDEVVVLDNNPEPEETQWLQEQIELANQSRVRDGKQQNISLISNHSNVGLSAAYNIGTSYAVSRGHEFVLFLDQDSRLMFGSVGRLLEAYSRITILFKVGAISCTNVELVPTSDNPWVRALDRVRYGLYSAQYKSGRLTTRVGCVEVPTFTNSGTAIPTKVLTEVGQFNQDLFLDAVDFDYSLRLRTRKFRLFVVPAAQLTHERGKSVRAGRLSLGLRYYSPERAYHIVRDTLTFARRWFRPFPRVVIGISVVMIVGVSGAIILLPDHSSRASSVIRAIWDFGHGGRDRTIVKPSE